jgi:hypothetical protein
MFAMQLPPFDRRLRELKGFVFQGWDERARRWVVLFESRWEAGPNPRRVVRVGMVDTELDFAKVRWLEIEPMIRPGTWLAIEAVEIHGTIRVPEEQLERIQPEEEADPHFDPWAIPDYE